MNYGFNTLLCRRMAFQIVHSWLFLVCAAAQCLRGADDGLPFVRVASDGWNFELDGGRREVHSGQHALQVLVDRFGDATLSPATNHAEVRQPIKLSGGGTRLSASAWWLGRLEKGGEIRLLLSFRDSQQKEIASAKTRAAFAGARWRRLAVTAAAPRGAESVDFVIQVAAFGVFSIDDAYLSNENGRNLLENPGFEMGWSGWRQGVQPENIGALWINDTRFVPWGLNYDRTILDGKDLLLEEAPIAKVDRDLREARRIGANAVRVFLELSRFMPRYRELDESMFAFFDQVVQRARKYNLRLDVTGLSHIDAAAFPAWYNERSDEEVMAAERDFWEAMARRYAFEPSIFLFDLQNEPFISHGPAPLKIVGCFTMREQRQFCYVNPHFRQIAAPPPASASDEQKIEYQQLRRKAARDWTKVMVESIRRHDSRHLITIGFLPSAAPVFSEGSPGFVIPELADLLDVIAIHLYPSRKAPRETYLEFNQAWLEMALRYAGGFGKPVIVEEWAPLWSKGASSAPTQEWFQRFLDASLPNASGWFTFYHVLLADGAESATPLPNEWIRLFWQKHMEMWTQPLKRIPGSASLKIDASRLLLNPKETLKVFDEYQRLRKTGVFVDFREE